MTDESTRPPQDQDALHAALRDLHNALDGSANLAASDRDDLVTAIDEIRAALGDGDSQPDTAGDQSTIGGRLRTAIDRFEDRHPDLTKIMGRIADSLSEMGI